MAYVVISTQSELLGWTQYHLMMSRALFSSLNNGQKIGQCSIFFRQLLWLTYTSKGTVVSNCTNILKLQSLQ